MTLIGKIWLVAGRLWWQLCALCLFPCYPEAELCCILTWLSTVSEVQFPLTFSLNMAMGVFWWLLKEKLLPHFFPVCCCYTSFCCTALFLKHMKSKVVSYTASNHVDVFIDFLGFFLGSSRIWLLYSQILPCCETGLKETAKKTVSTLGDTSVCRIWWRKVDFLNDRQLVTRKTFQFNTHTWREWKLLF